MYIIVYQYMVQTLVYAHYCVSIYGPNICICPYCVSIDGPNICIYTLLFMNIWSKHVYMYIIVYQYMVQTFVYVHIVYQYTFQTLVYAPYCVSIYGPNICICTLLCMHIWHKHLYMYILYINIWSKHLYMYIIVYQYTFQTLVYAHYCVSIYGPNMCICPYCVSIYGPNICICTLLFMNIWSKHVYMYIIVYQYMVQTLV